jgi:hypothetical protein
MAPPVEQTASIAAAVWPLKPIPFIIGIVKTPSITTFEATDPEIAEQTKSHY